MEKIAKRYGLDLDDDWNRMSLPHNGKHPATYHKFVLEEMRANSKIAGNSQAKFLAAYNKNVIDVVVEDPAILYRKTLFMTSFHFVLTSETGNWAPAFSKDDLDPIDFADEIDNMDLSQWKPIPFVLRSGKLADLIASDVLLNLCSERFREIVERFDTDFITWLPIELQQGRKKHTYYHMRFSNTDPSNYINKSKSYYVNGKLFSEHISLRKASKYPIFCFDNFSCPPIIRNDLKLAVKKECVGLMFEKRNAS